MIFNAIDADIMFEKSHEKGQIIIRSADTNVSEIGTLLLPANV